MHMQAGVVYSNPNARIHGDQLLGLCIMICSGLHSVLYVLSGGRRSLMISSSGTAVHIRLPRAIRPEGRRVLIPIPIIAIATTFVVLHSWSKVV